MRKTKILFRSTSTPSSLSVLWASSLRSPLRFPPFYDENPIGIYQKILAGRLDIPRHVDGKAKDIIKRLLTIDRTSRLGKRGTLENCFPL